MNRNDLHAYLDGELEASERARIERELESDESLRAELESLRAVQNALDELPAVEASADFTDRVTSAEEAGQKSILLLIRRAGSPRFVALALDE